jgi:uncharacterized phage protein (TIGR01671 family)
MNREIKFRVWDKLNSKWEKEMGVDQEGNITDLSECFWNNEGKNGESYICQQYTGLKDINGKEIHEGDIVVAYPQEFEKTHIEDNIYYADTSKPLPIIDIVLFKGVVIYATGQFRIEVEKNERGVASIMMGSYWLEIVGNILENLELLNKYE